MRIGIDFHPAEREGTGNCSYIRNLVQAILEVEPRHELYLYVGDPRHPYYDRFGGADRVRLRPLLAPSAPARWLSLGLLAKRDKVDLLHVQYVAPPFFSGPLVVSVHDLAFADQPQFFPWRMRAYLGLLVPHSLRRATRVMTLSQFSRRALASRYPFCSDKIRVGPLAAAPGLARTAGRAGTGAESVGVRGPFILYVGRLDARKNIPALVQAFSALRSAGVLEHRLVLVGPKDHWPEAMEREILTSPYRTEVVRTGVVSEEVLAGLYAAADVFVYPSLYEGFGLPVLEAMASGCPVVAMNAASIPEIVGDAGLLVSPGDTDSLAAAIRRVVSDKRLRAALIRNGKARARTYRWTETARLTLAAYREAAEGRA